MKIEDLQLWQNAGLASDNSQAPLAMCLDSLAPQSPADDVVPEEAIAKDLICILSKVINFVTAGDAVYPRDYALPEGQRVTLAVAQDILSQHWHNIRTELEKWHGNLPQSCSSTSHTTADTMEDSLPDSAHERQHGFPKIYYETPICAATMLSFHMASILLYANRPMESTAIRSSVSARLRHYQQDMQRTNRHARDVCGIVGQERSESVLVHAIQPLFVAGQVFSTLQDQAAVSSLLKNIEDKTGWSTSWFIDTMRKNWNA
ncbi:hypothetical protein PFICI_00001 [Pestalotiopsis fici W106-1]|uniref:Transcription factor domain-containing protein n=1 Tax=Pestalotiopsis fici (strain W106-1 / CGMCC3.15140) TaxID=1229662 RepID=W3XJE1_PESFW|nr:uncharacterized protein PFICI_00001 [Pestalotiopsis fici W106-1]ETS86173.1 hypothetical protein PFICI_00001 [Pestalotiopsis fici W106-1]